MLAVDKTAVLRQQSTDPFGKGRTTSYVYSKWACSISKDVLPLQRWHRNLQLTGIVFRLLTQLIVPDVIVNLQPLDASPVSQA